MRARIIIGLFFAFMMSIDVMGQSIPSAITYHGRITQADGTELPDGFYSFGFKIFNTASAGTLLWSEYQDVEVISGDYQVELGTAEPIPFSALNSPNAFLEVTVDGEIQSPRQRMVSAPFALRAEGEVPEGGIILGAVSGNTTILNYAYTQLAGNIGAYYLYQKNPYSPASKRVPTTIAYQGQLMPLPGHTIGSTENFIFGIYDAATAGNQLWSETQSISLWTTLIFNAELGKIVPIYPTTLSDKDLWLAVSVKGQALHPRENLTAAAYALKIESPVPPSGIVLSATTNNQFLIAKKFTQVGTIGTYYLYSKDAFSAPGSVPLLVNYQGYLVGLDGSTISGTRDMQFSIYDSQSGSTLLWTEMQSGVSVSRSIYHVLLGSVTLLTPATFSGPDAFLQVAVTFGATLQTLSPRTRITSVPYAMQAEGTMPPSSLILGSTIGSFKYNDTGFIYAGSTISGHPIFVKKDVDITPPVISIVRPLNYSAWNISSIPITFNFSDDLSGVDPSSFSMYLNGTTVSSGFTVTESGVVGSVAAAAGMNIIWIYISDASGNVAEDATYFYMDITGVPPDIIISPGNGTNIATSTPQITVDMMSNSGIDRWSVLIKINGIDKTEEFRATSFGANTRYIWLVPGEDALPNGSNTIEASCRNMLGLMNDVSSTFDVNDTGTHPSITGFLPAMALAGETIKIQGTFQVPSNKVVTFFNGYDGAQAQINSEAGNTLMVTVPQEALSGSVTVKEGEYCSNSKNFIVGFGYGLVANDHNQNYPNEISHHKLSVVIFDSDTTPGRHKNRIPLGNADPFDVAVSPDGKMAYATDTMGNKIYAVNTSLADSETTAAILDSMIVERPRYLIVSPSEPEIFVGTTTGYVYRIRNNAVQDGATYKLNLGGTINELAISPLYQRLYVAKSTGTTTAGEIYWVDIDHSSPTFMQATKITGTTYRNPIGVAIKPDQSEVYVANNNSNGSNDANSFSVFNANGSAFIRTQGATITPTNDTHDVGRPRQMVFDPRGQLFYSTFAGGGAPSTYTNNIGVERWRATSTNFEGGTRTETGPQNENPRGIAVSPDGKWIFTASYGAGGTYRDRLKILNHAKVKLAIDNDQGDSSYNLTQDISHPTDAVECLDDIDAPAHPLYQGMIKYTASFDGPQNIAFHDQPVIELYPHVLHLAKGGVAPDHEIIHARVHPIYGDSVTVGVNTGTTLTYHIKFPQTIATFTPRWLADLDTRGILYGTTEEKNDSIGLMAKEPGIGEMLASVKNYPSNITFVTVPTQEFIQILYGEACHITSEITYRALASVIKNRIRLSWKCFHDSPLPGDCYYFDFPPVTHPKISGKRVRKLNGGEQITATNANEEKAVEQIKLAFNSGFYSKGTARYKEAASRVNIVDTTDLMDYDNCVDTAGDALYDLSVTLTNSDTLWHIHQPDPNYMDLYKDPTGGSFSFYSPTNEQWGDSSKHTSIAGALDSNTTEFPTDGQFESTTVCINMFSSFCVGDPPKATFIQVVVVDGIPLNYNACGGSSRNQSPQFIFFRLRNSNEKSVIKLP